MNKKNKKKNVVALAVFAAANIMMAAPAAAAASMSVGRETSQPIGHADYCMRYPQDCTPHAGGVKPVKLSRTFWAKVVQVNDAVNVMVQPRTDLQMWGKEEVWSYPKRQGDCEDYALEKRKQLIAAGVPESSLLMTVVLQPNGDGHAVLTLATDLGDFVLDNIEPRVLAWQATPYRFLKRQSAADSSVWVSINDNRRNSAVGSIK